MASRAEMAILADKLFEDYDADCDGSINREELKNIFRTLVAEVEKTQKVDDNRLNKLFMIYDKNDDKKLSLK
jgi:Ca2+-binding EF-hand superfamily protein